MAADGKEEARRVREAVEEKMRSRDYAGARRVLESQETVAKLDLASAMLTVCDILCSAEIQLPGCGVNWYWVLQLFPSAEVAVIEAQYRKLVSQLSPIKVDFPGTEQALQFIAEAFSVLSDPDKRADFDLNRNGTKNMADGSNSQIRCSGAVNSGDAVTTKTAVGAIDSDTPTSSRSKRTACEDCSGNGDAGRSAEELADEKQKKKICAQEVSWAATQVRSDEAAGSQRMVEAADENRSCSPQVRPKPDYYDFGNNKKVELYSIGQVWVAYDEENMPRRYARIDRIIQDRFLLYVSWFKPCPQSLNEKRWCDAGLPVSSGNFALESNKITVSGKMMFSHMFSDSVTKHPFEVYPKKGDVWAIYRGWDIEWCSEPGMTKKCSFEMVEILNNYSKDSGVKVAYLVKADGFKNVFQRYHKSGNELSFHVPVTKLLMFSHNVPAFRFLGGEMVGITSGMLELDPLAVPNNLVQDFSCSIVALADTAPRISEEVNCSDEASFSHMSNPSMNMMDTGGSKPGFQNRKPKWSLKDFAAEQVWAVYDGPDAMPRLYAKVTNVISLNEVCVTFLDPHPMMDEEIQWVEESLPVVCGIFRAGRGTSKLEMSRFSHLVNCDRSSKKSFYRIFPQKGEVWAMYKNWNFKWKSSDLVRYQCRVVEIISDFSEENGISICSLIEVNGRLTFFQRQLHEGFQLTRQISRLEMLSFSHRIPAFTVLGVKNREIPKGSWHLEPDALPPKFAN